MKPIFVICFLTILFAASGFLIVYNYSQEFVEAHPTVFVTGLTGILAMGMVGMMYSLLVSTAVERQRRN